MCIRDRAYIEEQIRSILAQSETDWQLLIRDDGSFDGTNAKLRQWAAKDARICLVQGGASGGAKQNFAKLMEQATAPYVMFCDQDDVWHADKIARTWAKMKQMEQQFGTQTPMLDVYKRQN